MSEDIRLQWETAEVDGTKLTVALGGTVDKAWRHKFATTVALLGEREWGEVTLKKQKVRVSDVEPGTEEKLRHFLESVVLQATPAAGPTRMTPATGQTQSVLTVTTTCRRL